MFDAQEHSLVVYIANVEGHGFGDTESGAIASQQDGGVFESIEAVEEALTSSGERTSGSFSSIRGRGKSSFFHGIFRVTV